MKSTQKHETVNLNSTNLIKDTNILIAKKIVFFRMHVNYLISKDTMYMINIIKLYKKRYKDTINEKTQKYMLINLNLTMQKNG